MNVPAAIEQAATLAAPVFKEQGWTWATIGGIPDWYQIRNQLMRMCAEVMDDRNDITSVGTGRLWVRGLWVDEENVGPPQGVRICLDLGRGYDE